MAYQQRHGPARTLRDMLAQEGQIMALAGCSGPTLDAEDIAYTREVLIPYLDAEDMGAASTDCASSRKRSSSLGEIFELNLWLVCQSIARLR